MIMGGKELEEEDQEEQFEEDHHENQHHHYHHQNDTVQLQQQYMEIDPSSSSHTLVPWSLPPPVHPLHNFQPNPVLFPPQYNPYGSGHFFNRVSPNRPPPSSLHFASYDTPTTTPPLSDQHFRFISESMGRPNGQAGPFGLGAELGMKMTAQEIMDAKALAASKSHSEAERRRRERINNHLAKLRSLLPSTTKTDKASLLAEVIQHVKELKRQTSLIAETNTIPSETDELSMMESSSDEDGRLVIKASLCCEDRADLLPDLIKTLKSLKLKTLKAEITTLGGRVRNILFITGEDEAEYTLNSVEEALKSVMEKGANNDESSSGTTKRQRTTVNNIP